MAAVTTMEARSAVEAGAVEAGSTVAVGRGLELPIRGGEEWCTLG